MTEFYADNGHGILSGASLASLAVDLTLGGLTLSAVPSGPTVVSPDFDPNIQNYSVTVPYGTTHVSTSAFTTASSGAQMSLHLSGGQSVWGGSSTSIAVADFPISVVVEPLQPTGASTSYSVALTVAPPPLSSNADLIGLGLSQGSLSPAFNGDTTSYAASVGYEVSSIDITPSLADIQASLVVNGTAVSSGQPVALSLTPGLNMISVVVTAEDGLTERSYSIAMTRALPSTDAALSTMTISGASLSPDFDADITYYSSTVAHDVESIDITPTLSDANASLLVNGIAASSGQTVSAPLALGYNMLSVFVTAEDGVTTRGYIIALTRTLPSSDAALSALALSSGSLSPTFDPAITTYTASVAHDVSSIDITPTLSDTNGTLTVQGMVATTGQPVSLPLAPGLNPINVTVTAEDGLTMRSYTLLVTRVILSTDATLSALELSGAQISPAFDPIVTGYAANVAHDVASIDITPMLSDANATLTVMGTVAASGQPVSVPLSPGLNAINVVVTAQDGVTMLGYTVAVTRQILSTEAGLSSLGVSHGTLSPAFASATTSYALAVPNDVATLSLTPATIDPHAAVTVNGSSLASGMTSQDIALAVGETTIVTTVTAEAGNTISYTIVVERLASDDATLAALMLSSGSLAFDPAQQAYRVEVGNDVSEMTVTPTARHAETTLRVNGMEAASGSATAAIALPVGETEITIVATAEDGMSVMHYSIVVLRAPSAEAALDEISFSPDAGELVPAFSPQQHSYTMDVPNNVTRFSMRVVASNSAAQTLITLNGVPFFPAPTVLSSLASVSPTSHHDMIEIPLEVGENTIGMQVIAEDGTTNQSYTIAVTRAASTDGSLVALTLSAGELSPAFTSGVNSYDVEVAHSVDSLRLRATAAHAAAVIRINGDVVASGAETADIPLAVGSTSLSIMVAAEDGSVTTYALSVQRASSAAFEFAQAEEEIRTIVQQENLRTTRARLVASERFNAGARDRFIERRRAGSEVVTSRSSHQFSWNGVLRATDSGAIAKGDLVSRASHGEWERFFFGTFDLSRDKDGSTTGTASARMAFERMINTEAMLGVFVGGDLSKSDISAQFDGDSRAFNLSTGVYGVAQIGEAIWLDGFASLGTGWNDLTLSNGTLALEGDYGTRSVLMGMAMTGSLPFASFELRPQIAISHATTWIGEVPFEASAFGDRAAVSLDAGKVQVTRLHAAPEMHIPLSGFGRAVAQARVAPRVICERSNGARSRTDCGAGIDLGLSLVTGRGATSLDGSLSFEKVGSFERRSIGLDLVHRF